MTPSAGQGGGLRSGGGLSRLSSGGSGSPHPLKKRARSALQSDDDDLDTPLDKRNGAKKARQRSVPALGLLYSLSQSGAD